ncbi:MAG: HAD-IA family hydrolase [Hahellaceae bacterium]|nr:HAD-IA family hydrolase [Hahellaceae bacterium]MCP5209816.1 HAD-IA family hydrolase [Hahellaceae bacterium]
MSQITVISLDLDNTLWHAEPVLIAAEKAMRDWLMSHAPGVIPGLGRENLLQHKQHLLAEYPELQHQVSQIRLRLLQNLLDEAGYRDSERDDLARQAFQVFYNARQKVTLFQPVLSVLETLSQQYQLISITNGNANPEVIGIAPYFSYAFSAESEGISKPHARIFENALATLSVPAEAVLHVGDHLTDDVAGAAAVGMKTVWINADLQSSPVQMPVKADAVIRCIGELPAIVASL